MLYYIFNMENTIAKTEHKISEQVLMSWNSPSRVFKKRGRRFFTTIATIILVVSLLSALSGQFALIAVIVALSFLVYALSAVEPDDVFHKITVKGISYCGGKFYPYEELKVFFFTEKGEKTTLNVDTKKYYPGRLYMLIDKKNQGKIREVLGKYLNFVEEPTETVFDKASALASKYFSLE